MPLKFPADDRAAPRAYALAMAIVAAALGAAFLLQPLAGIVNVYLAFLTAVIGIAARHGLGPSIIGALASVLACNFFFLPPLYTFAIADPGNAVTLAFFLLAALITSNLAARARAEAVAARRRADTTQALYSFSRSIADTTTPEELLPAVAQQIASVLHVDVMILLPDVAGVLQMRASSPPLDPLDESDQRSVQATWRSLLDDDRRRDPVRIGERLFLAMRTSHGAVGLAGIGQGGGATMPTPEDERLLGALLDQAAVAIERIRLAGERDEAHVAAETERLRSVLLASLSHDLKTPLASITGAVTALRQYGAFYDAAARDELAATIQEEADRLARFVVNLLDMTRLEARAIVLDRQPVDVAEVVETALRRTAAVLGRHRVAVDLAPDLPMLDLDPVLFEQVLVNLLDNAARYSPPGTTVAVVGQHQDGKVTVAVADEGRGLSPADLPRVFDKFYRAEQGDNRRSGTGLGLAICRGFVEALGGEIHAGNRPDRSGAVFTIAFPAAIVALPNAVPG